MFTLFGPTHKTLLIFIEKKTRFKLVKSFEFVKSLYLWYFIIYELIASLTQHTPCAHAPKWTK